MGSMQSSFSAECIQACPSVDALQQELTSAVMQAMSKHSGAMQQMSQQSQSGGGGNMDMSKMGPMVEDLTLAQYGVMCGHREAMTCLAEHSAVCAEGEDDALQMGTSSLDCMCSACPCLQSTMAEMASMLMGVMGMLGSAFAGENTSTTQQEDATQQMMGAFCKMAPGFACVQREPTACGAFMGEALGSDEGGILGMFGDGGNSSGLLDQNATEMGQQCASMGHSVDTTTCTLEKETEPTSGAFRPSLVMLMPAGLTTLLCAW